MLIRPLISEKSMGLLKSSFYTFEVSKNATKEQIAKLVNLKFSVDVLSVKTINLPKRIKMQRSKKGYFEVAGIKKAIVKLKKGQKIPLFEVAKAEEEKQDVEVRTAEGEVIAKTKEKKSFLRGTKVTIESSNKNQESSKKVGKQSKKGDKP